MPGRRGRGQQRSKTRQSGFSIPEAAIFRAPGALLKKGCSLLGVALLQLLEALVYGLDGLDDVFKGFCCLSQAIVRRGCVLAP
jgi:hypothetical protein